MLVQPPPGVRCACRRRSQGDSAGSPCAGAVQAKQLQERYAGTIGDAGQLDHQIGQQARWSARDTAARTGRRWRRQCRRTCRRSRMASTRAAMRCWRWRPMARPTSYGVPAADTTGIRSEDGELSLLCTVLAPLSRPPGGCPEQDGGERQQHTNGHTCGSADRLRPPMVPPALPHCYPPLELVPGVGAENLLRRVNGRNMLRPYGLALCDRCEPDGAGPGALAVGLEEAGVAVADAW